MEQGGPEPTRSARLAHKYPGGWSTPGLVPKRKLTSTKKLGRPAGLKDKKPRRIKGSSYRKSQAENLQGHAAAAHAAAAPACLNERQARVWAGLETALDGLDNLSGSDREDMVKRVLAELQGRGVKAPPTAAAGTPGPPAGDAAVAQLAPPAVAAASPTPAASQSAGAGPAASQPPSTQLPAKRPSMVSGEDDKPYDELDSRQRAAAHEQISAALEAACETEEGVAAFIRDYLAERVGTLAKLATTSSSDVMARLVAQLCARVLAGNEQVPMTMAMAMRKCLNFSDEQYSLLQHFLPANGLPSLDALRKSEEELCTRESLETAQ